MKPGDLRRFTVNDVHAPTAAGERWSVGDIFMVLKVVQPRGQPPHKQVTFLVGDRIEEGWGLAWIMNYSEALDEAG